MIAGVRSARARSRQGPNTRTGRRELVVTRAASRGPSAAPTPIAPSGGPNPPGPGAEAAFG